LEKIKFPYVFVFCDIPTIVNTELMDTVIKRNMRLMFWLMNRFGINSVNKTWCQMHSKEQFIYGFVRQKDAVEVTLLWSDGSEPYQG